GGWRLARTGEGVGRGLAGGGDADAVEALHAARELALDCRPQRVPVDERFRAYALVKVQRGLEIREDAEVVHDDAGALLHRGKRPVGTGDGLEQVVVPQRLVEIHHLLDGRVEAGEQTVADDQDLERRSPLAPALAVALAVPRLPLCR